MPKYISSLELALSKRPRHTTLPPVSTSWTALSLAGFQAIIVGRFWVITEGGMHTASHCYEME